MTAVSVIIPAYNAGATIDRTLASVRAQRHTNLEIIIIDDGSTDDTAQRATVHARSDARIRVVRQENQGVAAARNHGVSLATSAWVAPLDADDLWSPRAIEALLAAAAAEDGRVVLAYTWSRRIDASDRLIVDLGRPRYRGEVLGALLVSNFVRNASATLLDRRAVVEAGGYDSGFQAIGAHGAEDIDLYLRLAKIGRAAVAPGYHVGYRQMPGSMSVSADRMRSSVDLVLEKLHEANPGLSRKLYTVARANYDLYAAGLSFAGGQWRGVARYAGRALRRAPAASITHLSIVGAYGVYAKLRRREMPVFADLDPDRSYTWPAADLHMRALDRLVAAPLRSAATMAA